MEPHWHVTRPEIVAEGRDCDRCQHCMYIERDMAPHGREGHYCLREPRKTMDIFHRSCDEQRVGGRWLAPLFGWCGFAARFYAERPADKPGAFAERLSEKKRKSDDYYAELRSSLLREAS